MPACDPAVYKADAACAEADSCKLPEGEWSCRGGAFARGVLVEGGPAVAPCNPVGKWPLTVDPLQSAACGTMPITTLTLWVDAAGRLLVDFPGPMRRTATLDSAACKLQVNESSSFSGQETGSVSRSVAITFSGDTATGTFSVGGSGLCSGASVNGTVTSQRAP